MKHQSICAALALGLLLNGCASAPLRDGSSRLNAAVSAAGAGAPRLPLPGEATLDSEWFTQPMTLNYAVQAALLNNPQVRAELARLDGAQAERVQAGLIRNPMASLMALRPEGGGRFELDYSLMQSLFDLLTRSRRIAVADAAQAGIEADVLGHLIGFAQDTEAAYYQALAAQAMVRLQKEQLGLEQDSLTLLQRQARQGALPDSAALEQEATVSMRSHELRDAESMLSQARATLAGQLGLSSAKPLVLPDTMPPFDMPGLDEPALQALARAHRPELEAATAAVAQARAEKSLQTGSLRATDPSLGPAGTRESGGTELNGLAVQITVPIFDTGRARRALADANLAQAQFMAEAERRQVPLEVERALATLIAAMDAAHHADHHLRQQEQLQQLALKTYQQGSTDYLRYRDAIRNRLASAMDQLRAQQSLWAARVDLERSTGIAATAPDFAR